MTEKIQSILDSSYRSEQIIRYIIRVANLSTKQSKDLLEALREIAYQQQELRKSILAQEGSLPNGC